MDFYELKNKYFSLVRKKMINDYKMGNIDFMESEELLDHIIREDWKCIRTMGNPMMKALLLHSGIFMENSWHCVRLL